MKLAGLRQGRDSVTLLPMDLLQCWHLLAQCCIALHTQITRAAPGCSATSDAHRDRNPLVGYLAQAQVDSLTHAERRIIYPCWHLLAHWNSVPAMHASNGIPLDYVTATAVVGWQMAQLATAFFFSFSFFFSFELVIAVTC